VIKTIAQRHRHSGRPLHFYVFERQPEVLARSLMLLAAAVDWELPVRQRAATWLELFGNAALQGRTAKYLSDRLRPALIDLACDGRGLPPLASVLDWTGLKFKQRDELVDAWRAYSEGVPFDMALLRDTRLRHNYGTRYDFRNNLVDWDYQAVIRRAAGAIHYTQYREWRNSGVAFEFGDGRYDAPNRSLASYVEGREGGRSTMRRGFWGDTVMSPYHAVATATYVPTDAEAAAAAAATAAAGGGGGGAGGGGGGNYAYQLYDISARRAGSETWRHHAVEIAMHNLLSWLFEIETGTQYVMRREHDLFSGLEDARVKAVGATAASASAPAAAGSSEEEVAAARAAAGAAAAGRARAIAAAFAGVRIVPLMGDAAEWLAKGKHAGRFAGVVLGGRTVHLLAHAALPALLAPGGGIVVAETARNVPSLNAAQALEYTRRVMGMAGAAGLTLVDSDRALSADTYAVGSVLDVTKPAPAADGGGAAAGAAVVPPQYFAPLPTWLPAALRSPAATTTDAAKVQRVKGIPMVALSHNPAPHPAVAPLLSLPRTADASLTAATARAAAVRHAAFMRGLETHDVAGGDNPLPEAVIFAGIPRVIPSLAALFAPPPPPAPAAAAAPSASGGGGAAAAAAAP